MTAWRSILSGGCFGFVLGALAGWLFRAEIDMPLNPNGWEELLITLNVFGWHLLPALIGAFLGWLAWRRAKQRTARTPFSS
jgi:hypothetical protein